MKKIYSNNALTAGKHLAGFLLVVLLVLGCKDDFTSPASPSGPTITAQITSNDNLTIMVAAMAKVNETNSLDNINSGVFTVFAPTDSAFLVYFSAKLGKVNWTADSVVAYINTKMSTSSAITIAALNTIITYHIVSSTYTSSTIHDGLYVMPLSGARLSLSKAGDQIVLNGNVTTTLGGFTGAKSKSVDVTAANGVIHTINRVVFPPTIATVAAALGVSVNNGVVPPAITVSAAASNYNVFANALAVTVLADTLLPITSPLPEFTVFVPSDGAFVSYLETVSDSVVDETSAIKFVKARSTKTTPTLAAFTEMIRYHMIKGRWLSTDFTAGTEVATFSKGNSITADFTALTITDKKGDVIPITTPNQATGAGVFHVIGGVLQLQ